MYTCIIYNTHQHVQVHLLSFPFKDSLLINLHNYSCYTVTFNYYRKNSILFHTIKFEYFVNT